MTCSLAVTDYLGPYVGQAMCFITDFLEKTGMMFFIQLLLDLAVLFMAFSFVYNALIDVVSMFTGVNLPRILRGGGDANTIPSMLKNIEIIKERQNNQ
jgi:hypothetical protein